MKGPLIAIASLLFAVAALAGTPNCVTITSVTPSSGPAGTQVVINGSGFLSCCPFECAQPVVTFGGTQAQIVSVTDTQIVVTAPSVGPGAVSVTVQQLSGTATVANAFTFVAGVPALAPITTALVAVVLIIAALVRLR